MNLCRVCGVRGFCVCWVIFATFSVVEISLQNIIQDDLVWRAPTVPY